MIVSDCVEVRDSDAEKAIEALRSSGLLLPSSTARSDRSRGVVRIPVVSGYSSLAVEILGSRGIEASLCMDFFKTSGKGVRYVDLLRDTLPEDVLSRIPRSYQQVGDIAIVHIPEDLLRFGSAIGEAIARVSKAVKAVYASLSTEGEFRVRKLRKLWGEDRTETIHVEYGVRMVLDIERVYFNPTLSYEHWRVSEEVSDGEIVLDLFSGIGPYSLHIASKRVATCFAVDSNPYAAIYLARSMALNKLRGRIVPVLSKVEEFFELLPDNLFSRSIVDLPHRSLEYLEPVVKVLRCGGYAHFYVLMSEAPQLPELGSNLRLVEVRKVLEYAPRKYIYGVKIVKVC